MVVLLPAFALLLKLLYLGPAPVRAMKSVYGGRWIGVFATAVVLGVCYFVLAGVIVVGLLLTAVLLR